MTTPAQPRRTSLWSLALLLAVIWGGSQLMHMGQGRAQGEAMRQAHPEGRITLYTTLTCVYCARAKDWLDSQHVPYKECRVDTNAPCGAVYRTMGEPGTPVVQVDTDQFHLGFDPDWVIQALGAKPR